MICDARAHILDWELSMTAWFSGCLVRSIETTDGILTWDRIRSYLRPAGPHNAPTALVEIENTHNMAGGTVYPQDTIDEICTEAHKLGLKVHMDGARVFNASAACGKSVAEITRGVDTVMFCLSKGLGAPVGSLVVGRKEAIAKGRSYRKRLGGGMRQTGILAAAGLIALEEMPKRLGEDHANTNSSAALAQIPGVQVTPPQTNIVIFDVAGTGWRASEISARLKELGVIINPVTPSGPTMRAVTTMMSIARDSSGPSRRSRRSCLPRLFSLGPRLHRANPLPDQFDAFTIQHVVSEGRHSDLWFGGFHADDQKRAVRIPRLNDVREPRGVRDRLRYRESDS